MTGQLPPQAIFRAHDIRGTSDDSLNTDYARQIGMAIGSISKD